MRIFKAGIPVTSGAGNWSNATSNPVEEINNLILQIHKSIGRMPTHLVIGLQAWSILQNNAKMLSRIGGVDVDVTIERVQRMLVYPGIKIVVANLPYQPAARGVKGSKTYVMGADVFCTMGANTEDVAYVIILQMIRSTLSALMRSAVSKAAVLEPMMP